MRERIQLDVVIRGALRLAFGPRGGTRNRGLAVLILHDLDSDDDDVVSQDDDDVDVSAEEKEAKEEENTLEKLENAEPGESSEMETSTEPAVGRDRLGSENTNTNGVASFSASHGPRQVLPKGKVAKALSRRSRAVAAAASAAVAQRHAVAEAASLGLPGSSLSATVPPPPPHAALIHAPLTSLQLNAQKRRRENQTKKATKRGWAKNDAAVHAASMQRGAVSRRRKMAVCFSGANNNRKCNTAIGIRC